MLGEGMRHYVAHDLSLEWVYVSLFCIVHLGISTRSAHVIHSLLRHMSLTEQC